LLTSGKRPETYVTPLTITQYRTDFLRRSARLLEKANANRRKALQKVHELTPSMPYPIEVTHVGHGNYGEYVVLVGKEPRSGELFSTIIGEDYIQAFAALEFPLKDQAATLVYEKTEGNKHMYSVNLLPDGVKDLKPKMRKRVIDQAELESLFTL